MMPILHALRRRAPVTFLLLLLPLALAQNAFGQNLGGGAAGPGGFVPKFDVVHWTPGVATRFEFTDLPSGARTFFLIVSQKTTNQRIPGIQGTLRADITPGVGAFAVGPRTLPFVMPKSAAGTSAVIQGCVVDSSGKAWFTDATRVDVFKPFILVGNERGDSIQSMDLQRRAVQQTVSNSQLGHIVFSADRKWAYATEPGLNRRRVAAHALSGSLILSQTNISVSGTPSHRAAYSKSAQLLFVPQSSGISVIDVNPKSLRFHTEIRVLKVPIQGGSAGTGPVAVQLDGSESKLYVLYNERLTYPAKTTLGVFDLKKANVPHRTIKITTGGTVFTRTQNRDLLRSPDGKTMFVIESGAPPGPSVLGFQRGGLLKILSTTTDTEVRVIPSTAYGAKQLAIDRNGRTLWLAMVDMGLRGVIVGLDVDPKSPCRFSVKHITYTGTTKFYPGLTGPSGIGTTPDGSTVCFTIYDGPGHWKPEFMTLDARTGKLFGKPIAVGSYPRSLSISQY